MKKLHLYLIAPGAILIFLLISQGINFLLAILIGLVLIGGLYLLFNYLKKINPEGFKQIFPDDK